MKQYCAPEIKFEEITFFERIASTDCWHGNGFYFNVVDSDGKYDIGTDIEINKDSLGISFNDQGCLVSAGNLKNAVDKALTGTSYYQPWFKENYFNDDKARNTTSVYNIGFNASGFTPNPGR